MRLLGRLVPCVVAGLVLATPAAAIDPVGLLQVRDVDVTNYPQARAVVVPPRELTTDAISKGTFSVLEGGQAREAIVEPLPVGNLDVVLVIDTSGSMKGEAIASARRAATSFVQSMPADARLAVVGFGSVAAVRSSFTTDRAKTTAALAALQVRGQTSLHDALITGSKLFGDGPLPAGARRVIVVLSDGGDTASKSSLADASSALKAASVSLSAIALATRESDNAALTLLATAAGGAVAPAVDPAALKGVFDSVANSVLRQYRLRWTSGARGATDVTLSLQAGERTWQTVQPVSFPALPTTVQPLPVSGPAPVPSPVTVRTRIGPVTSGDSGLFAGLAAGFLAALLAAGLVLWPRPPKRRLAVEMGVRPRHEVSGFSQGIIRTTRAYFQRHGRGAGLGALLERAGMTIDAPTAAVLAGVVALLGVVVGLVLGGVFVALLVGALGTACFFMVIKFRADRRSAKFRDQFESALQIIINSLRSGYGVSQAIETVARESEAPTSEEFRRIVTETSLGMDLIDALEACAHRVACDELVWVSQSMEVNRDVGGNLADVLTGVATTIRSRIRLARQIRAVSAEGRLSAKLLLASPLAAFAAQASFNRSNLGLLFRGGGLFFLAAGVVFMAIGYVWTRQIVRIKY